MDDEVESLNSMQLLSVATPALMSSLLKPNKRLTPPGSHKQNGNGEGGDASEEGEEMDSKEAEAREGAEGDDPVEEDAEHIRFLKQVRNASIAGSRRYYPIISGRY